MFGLTGDFCTFSECLYLPALASELLQGSISFSPLGIGYVQLGSVHPNRTTHLKMRMLTATLLFRLL